MSRRSEVSRCIVVNGQNSGAKLPESDREDMEVFLEKVYQLLPVLGVELLVSVSSQRSSGTKQQETLHCDIKGVKAQGYLIPSGFLVLKGSEAVHAERPSVKKWPWPRNMRQKLLEEGALIDKKDRLEFAEDVEFSSPSAAATVIHGGHTNGLAAWKNAKGKSLKEMEYSPNLSL